MNRQAPVGPLPHLTIPQLEYLVAVADAPTWTEASAAVGVSQSALSQGLAELQRRLGVVLFERNGRGRTPMPAAAEVTEYARRVLAQTRDLGRWAANVAAGRAGELRVGMIDAAAVHHFPEVLRRFQADRPELSLHLTVAPSGALLDQLRVGDLDLVVCVAPSGHRDDLDIAPILDEELLVYGPTGAQSGEIGRWGPWVMFPVESHTRAVITKALHELGATLDVVAESNQPEVLREMVQLGMGYTVLPASQGAPLAPVRRESIGHRQLVIARRSNRPPDPAGDHLTAALLP